MIKKLRLLFDAGSEKSRSQVRLMIDNPQPENLMTGNLGEQRRNVIT